GDAGAEGTPRDFIHDQIDIALTVARLLVDEPVELVRQRPQRLREQAHRIRFYRKLSGLSLEQHALRAQDVADVPLLERFVRLPERLALQVKLDLARHVLQMAEARLAHNAPRHQATGDFDAHRHG